MNKKLLSLYGLKWSPFSSEVPTEALYVTPRVESFCWRVEQLTSEGGFALVTGYEKEFVMGSTARMLLISMTSGPQALLIISWIFTANQAMSAAPDPVSSEAAFQALPTYRPFQGPCALCRDSRAHKDLSYPNFHDLKGF